MLTGVNDEIERLAYTIEECEAGTNPHNLDIPWMKRCLKALEDYRACFREAE